ncbi:alpha/beta fold hydrolase [Roseospira visakhapatnamensis]|uniref:Pimeloyl-ACP methyl ester carboxylesterase n=1 Tax=Roseospira visakhapatnamensis TaxID=390880 RepID=A0A7W6W9C9_9PROT|nr:alpha/beta fold hydrolase [Roseospira visakhapatnamensis]MBB4265322.1 pimeloyl-ACP methyl ester carboxylesterase [Roseospira visakhapatnamensis]
MTDPHHPIIGSWRALGAGLGLALAAAAPARAEPVSLAYHDLTLTADHRVADGAAASDPTVLLVHGTLAHNGMEIMTDTQAALAERGLNTLAITLGLGVDARQGSFACDQPHRHKHTDAMAEIGAWVDWLVAREVDTVVLLGHSRGGNQVAWYLTDSPAPVVTGAVLVAPALWNARAFAQQYEAATGRPLADLLAEAKDQEPDTLMDLDRFLYCQEARVAAGTVLDYYGDDARRHTPTLLGDVDVPTVVVVGTADDVVPGLMENLAGMDSDTVSVQEVEGATHYFTDLYVEDIADAVETVIDR